MKFKTIYFMMLPIILFFLVFSYYPLLKGLYISFQDYKLIGSVGFNGLDNYKFVLNDANFWSVFRNTLFIGGGTLLFGFIMPIILALSLNEVFSAGFKKFTQMAVYIPHLFSWVVVGGMWILLLSPDTGIVNQVLLALGAEKPITFLASQDKSPWVIIFISTWKEMGYTCILYLAAIVSINPSLYEAARIDGANRWHQVRYVTIPQLFNTMKVVFMLNILGVLRLFDPIFVMRNGANANAVDVIMMYTYQKGIMEFKVAQATAAGFIVILCTLILTLIVRKVIKYDEGGS